MEWKLGDMWLNAQSAADVGRLMHFQDSGAAEADSRADSGQVFGAWIAILLISSFGCAPNVMVVHYYCYS